jgi:hypothetical protein
MAKTGNAADDGLWACPPGASRRSNAALQPFDIGPLCLHDCALPWTAWIALVLIYQVVGARGSRLNWLTGATVIFRYFYRRFLSH